MIFRTVGSWQNQLAEEVVLLVGFGVNFANVSRPGFAFDGEVVGRLGPENESGGSPGFDGTVSQHSGSEFILKVGGRTGPFPLAIAFAAARSSGVQWEFPWE